MRFDPLDNAGRHIFRTPTGELRVRPGYESLVYAAVRYEQRRRDGRPTAVRMLGYIYDSSLHILPGDKIMQMNVALDDEFSARFAWIEHSGIPASTAIAQPETYRGNSNAQQPLPPPKKLLPWYRRPFAR